LDKLLWLLHWLLQKQFYGRRHERQLYCCRLFRECLQELLQQLICRAKAQRLLDKNAGISKQQLSCLCKAENTHSPALSMRSEYSPMIHTMEALASGSSKLSRLSHKVPIMLS
jgi:hypothetical protein